MTCGYYTFKTCKEQLKVIRKKSFYIYKINQGLSVEHTSLDYFVTVYYCMDSFYNWTF